MGLSARWVPKDKNNTYIYSLVAQPFQGGIIPRQPCWIRECIRRAAVTVELSHKQLRNLTSPLSGFTSNTYEIVTVSAARPSLVDRSTPSSIIVPSLASSLRPLKINPD